jgi:hypothetical protein
MSSTNGREELAMRFFRECLLPAAQNLQARGAELIPGARDSTAATYYAARRADESYIFDLSLTLADVLRSQWRDFPELVALADDLVRLARDLRQKEESVEVSPFIYAMF